MNDRTREAFLWEWLSKARAVFGDRLHMQRIENLLDSGTPDVHGCVDGIGFVIELKSVPRPPGGRIWCEVKREQAMFLRARRRALGVAYVLIQVGTGASASRYLVPGEDSHMLLEPLLEDELDFLSIIHGGFSAVEVIKTICERR